MHVRRGEQCRGDRAEQRPTRDSVGGRSGETDRGGGGRGQLEHRRAIPRWAVPGAGAATAHADAACVRRSVGAMSGNLKITFARDMPAATVEVVAPDLQVVERVML